jgi:XTP/dITP diphosphohydrolase
MVRRRLLIGSNNPGKLRELTELLRDIALDLVRPVDLGLTLDVAETGSTYAENARIKALAFASASGLAALADDSGIELRALGGWPGIRSVRFAGPAANDADRRRRVLERLAGRPPPERRGRFVCAMALADAGTIVAESEGALTGTIAESAKGTGGFGYDPIFIPDGYSDTLAEIPPPEKNRISHRGQALARLRPALQAMAFRATPRE